MLIKSLFLAMFSHSFLKRFKLFLPIETAFQKSFISSTIAVVVTATNLFFLL